MAADAMVATKAVAAAMCLKENLTTLLSCLEIYLEMLRSDAVVLAQLVMKVLRRIASGFFAESTLIISVIVFREKPVMRMMVSMDSPFR